jgi:hypothetical protein
MNFDKNQFEDKFGNLKYEFEVIVYNKNINEEWVEDKRFNSGKSYYIVDSNIYCLIDNTLIKLNSDFDSESCGACYMAGEEIKGQKKIVNNEILFKSNSKNGEVLSLHKQSYSDGTCFYSLRDWNGNFPLNYASRYLHDIKEAVSNEIESMSDSMNNSETYLSNKELQRNIVALINWKQEIAVELDKVS